MPTETFDVISYLEDRGIEYHTSGKNVSRGWVEIHCPFPYCDDPSWHCGINLTSKMFNCFICGTKGPITKLIKEIDGCSDAEANTTVGEFQDYSSTLSGEEPVTPASRVLLPREAAREIPDLHRRYLEGRGFDPDYLAEKYGLRFCHSVGDWKFRIIIPIRMRGRLVSFTSRLVVDTKGNPYKHCGNDKAVVPVPHCLYNVDSVRKRAILVEGVTDVWRIGDGAVGLFGIEVVAEQVHSLAEQKWEEAFVLFDPESRAQEQAKKLAGQLNKFYPTNVARYETKSGDPGEFTEKQVRDLRHDIFGE
jgi:5S rRNA maturation endonuclease (ribonuclease M5)